MTHGVRRTTRVGVERARRALENVVSGGFEA